MTRLDPPPTLAEWKHMNLDRPLTDNAIGADVTRRALDAVRSELFTEPPSSVPVKTKGRK